MDGVNLRRNDIVLSTTQPGTTRQPSTGFHTGDFSAEPADHVSLQGLLEYSSKDITPEGTVNVIIEADNPEQLVKLKEEVTHEQGGKIKQDLPLIHGFSAEINPDSKGIIPLLEDSRIYLDGDRQEIETSCNAALEKVEISQEDIMARDHVSLKTMGVEKLWEKGITGKGSTICVIGTGIAQHPDLKDRIVEFKDFVNKKDGAANAYDDGGHESHCAGTAAGSGEASNGKFKGVAPEANLIGIKTLDEKGNGWNSDLIAALQWAVENKEKYGIDVITMSTGERTSRPAKDDPVVQAVEAAVAKGIIVCIAACNWGPTPGSVGSPGTAPSAITVGAVDDHGTIDRSDDTLARSSGRGPTKFDNLIKPDILAPGINIIGPKNTGGYKILSGTSMATPLVAGICLLLKQVKPDATPDEIKNAIMAAADRLEGQTPNDQGAGELNLERAYEVLTGQKL